MKINPNLSLAPILLGLLSLQAPAVAYWNCPVGVDPNGQNNSGIACTWYEEEVKPSYEYAPEPAPAQQHPRFSMDDIDALIAQKRAEERLEQQTEANDSTSASQGIWSFFQASPKDAKQFCQVSFQTDPNSGIFFMDTWGHKQVAYIGFYGGAIPPTADYQHITLSLSQGGKTQAVKAFHLPYMRDPSKGMYLFPVANTQALLNAMVDQQDFAVAANGQTMLQGVWVNGLKARKWLGNCAALK